MIWPYAVRRSSGYGAYSKKCGGRTTNHDAHRYVCERAHGKPAVGMEAAHRCGNKLCINPKHLNWADHMANMADAKVHGTLRGGGRYRQRFFEDDIAAILSSDESFLTLANRYNTDASYIGRLRRQYG